VSIQALVAAPVSKQKAQRLVVLTPEKVSVIEVLEGHKLAVLALSGASC
jgi:hypothetical protein